MLKRVAKVVAERLFGPYQLNRIYMRELEQVAAAPPARYDIRPISSAEQFAAAIDQRMREHAWYAGENAPGFGLWENERLVCTCMFWNHKRFSDSSPIRVGEREAVLVDVITAQESRGKGYAPALIGFAEAALKRAGFVRLYAWVWHSNHPSRRAFEKAGWKYVAFVVQTTPLGWGKPVRFEKRIHSRT